MKLNKLLFIISLITMQAFAQTIKYGNNSTVGKYAQINGINLYYEIYGTGKPLLMLHGNSGSINAFEVQIPYFSKYYKVIAVDSRLQGKSGGSPDTLSYEMMADDFASLLDYLNMDSVYVIGWSDGGIDGIILAMKYPAKVKMLAISGANTVCDSSAVPYSDIINMRNFVNNNKEASPKDITLHKMMLTQPNINYADLRNIKCPTLIMAGDNDIIKIEHTVKIFQSIPKANLCIFPQSGHGTLIQHANLFNTIVHNFFKE